MAVREIVRNARKNDGIPKTAQQSIPFDRMFPDGICRVGLDYYTKTVQFQDINYQLAQQEDKTEIFEEWCAFLNFFDSSVKFQLSFENMATDVSDFEKSIKISHKNDGFDDVRDDKLEMQMLELLDQLPDTGAEKDFYKVTDSNGKEYLSIKLKLRDILYFEYIKRSRKVLIALSDITYEYDCIFEKLVEELQPYDFVVNCRGNLVNLRHIEKIKGFTIYLDNGKELQIAQKRSSDFREEVNKFLQKNS